MGHFDNKNLRHGSCKEDGVDHEKHKSSWHHEHGSWIELPPAPVLSILAPELRELAVSFLVHFAEERCSVPGVFEADYANNGLDKQVDENNLIKLILDGWLLNACVLDHFVICSFRHISI